MNKELQFLIYSTPQESVKVDVQVPAISKHLKNIFEEGELTETVVVSKMEITTMHGAIAAFLYDNVSFFSVIK